MSTNIPLSKSDKSLNDDIFDPEIIYCVTKVVVEPFITCVIDRNNYEKGNDYSITYLESIENNYLCIAFGEELALGKNWSSKNITVKGNHPVMGTILVIGNKGGNILLNNPITNISVLYYSYIDLITDIPVFLKTSLISDTSEWSDIQVRQKDTIYISNNDIHKNSRDKNNPSDINSWNDRIPIGSWTPNNEIYPKRVMIVNKDYRDQSVIIPDSLSSPLSEYMTSSLPAINEDVEIVDVFVHPPTPRPVSIFIPINPVMYTGETLPISADTKEDELSKCCCIKYVIAPLYEWIITKIKLLRNNQKHPTSNCSFVDIELP